jgi:hypothetical protein
VTFRDRPLFIQTTDTTLRDVVFIRDLGRHSAGEVAEARKATTVKEHDDRAAAGDNDQQRYGQKDEGRQ